MGSERNRNNRHWVRSNRTPLTHYVCAIEADVRTNVDMSNWNGRSRHLAGTQFSISLDTPYNDNLTNSLTKKHSPHQFYISISIIQLFWLIFIQNVRQLFSVSVNRMPNQIRTVDGVWFKPHPTSVFESKYSY